MSPLKEINPTHQLELITALILLVGLLIDAGYYVV